MRVYAYLRCSTTEQRDSGLGIDAQRGAIEQEAARRGWDLVRVFEDAASSGKSLRGRPALQEALTAVASGEAEAIIVSRLDRLSRSLADFANMLERSRREGWSVIALDVALDTSSPSGELMAHVLSSFSQYERRLISARTRDALQVARERGTRLGRPREMDPAVAERIRALHHSGESLAEIARTLEREGVCGPRGGRLDPSAVRRVIRQMQAA